jgi:hypothetical protein
LLAETAREKGLVPQGEIIVGVWGIGYVMRSKEEGIPFHLSQIDISYWRHNLQQEENPPLPFSVGKDMAMPTGFNEEGLVIPGISVLDKEMVLKTTNPDPERVIRVFDGLRNLRRRGDLPMAKPILVDRARRLVSILANAGGNWVSMDELVNALFWGEAGNNQGNKPSPPILEKYLRGAIRSLVNRVNEILKPRHLKIISIVEEKKRKGVIYPEGTEDRRKTSYRLRNFN